MWNEGLDLLLEPVDDLWYCFEQVCDQADVCDLEDGCIRILRARSTHCISCGSVEIAHFIDGNDELGVLHASKMLNGARDA